MSNGDCWATATLTVGNRGMRTPFDRREDGPWERVWPSCPCSRAIAGGGMTTTSHFDFCCARSRPPSRWPAAWTYDIFFRRELGVPREGAGSPEPAPDPSISSPSPTLTVRAIGCGILLCCGCCCCCAPSEKSSSVSGGLSGCEARAFGNSNGLGPSCWWWWVVKADGRLRMDAVRCDMSGRRVG
jgi:hypothetical protein